MRIQKRDEGLRIPLTNMADIAYLLLIFIILFSLINTRFKAADYLPVSSNNEETDTIEKSSYKLTIKDNSFLLENVLFTDILQLSEELMSINNDFKIVIIADKNMSFAKVRIVLNELKKNGFKKVDFLVKN